MNSILGIVASSISGNLNTNSYESISTTTLSTATATITFSSIPATYKHLQLRVLARSTLATTQDNAFFRLNSDTTSSYSYHYIYGAGSGAASGSGVTQTSNLLDGEPGTSIGANIFATTILDILDYANTSKYKTSRMLTGWDGNGSGNIALHSGLWQNTSAISTITITNSASFTANSSFALYGIKG
jgi:hypothetical protein